MPPPLKTWRHVSPDGEVSYSQSLDGYEGWTSTEIDRLPGPDDEWDDKEKKLKEKPEKKAKREKRARFHDLREEGVMDLIDSITARMEALEKKMKTVAASASAVPHGD